MSPADKWSAESQCTQTSFSIRGFRTRKREEKSGKDMSVSKTNLATTEESHSCQRHGGGNTAWTWWGKLLGHPMPRSCPLPHQETPSRAAWGTTFCSLRFLALDTPSRPNTITKILKIKLSLKPQSTKVGQDLSAWSQQHTTKIKHLNRSQHLLKWTKCPEYNWKIALHTKNQHYQKTSKKKVNWCQQLNESCTENIWQFLNSCHINVSTINVKFSWSNEKLVKKKKKNYFKKTKWKFTELKSTIIKLKNNNKLPKKKKKPLLCGLSS